jgi:hypothetical protein
VRPASQDEAKPRNIGSPPDAGPRRDAPTPEAVRKTAARNQLPVDQITEIRVLDPYFYV